MGRRKGRRGRVDDHGNRRMVLLRGLPYRDPDARSDKQEATKAGATEYEMPDREERPPFLDWKMCDGKHVLHFCAPHLVVTHLPCA